MWTCPKCREKNDDEADVCWSCGTSREGVEDPEFRKADDVGSEYEGDRPLVEVLPETNVPEALQPREPRPVPRPRWRAAACPHCGSRNLALDAAAVAWLVPQGVVLFVIGWLLHAGGHDVAALLCAGAAFLVLLALAMAPGFCKHAWCRDCGVRFKRVDRLERPAQKEPLEREGPPDSHSRPPGQ